MGGGLAPRLWGQRQGSKPVSATHQPCALGQVSAPPSDGANSAHFWVFAFRGGMAGRNVLTVPAGGLARRKGSVLRVPLVALRPPLPTPRLLTTSHLGRGGGTRRSGSLGSNLPFLPQAGSSLTKWRRVTAKVSSWTRVG